MADRSLIGVLRAGLSFGRKSQPAMSSVDDRGGWWPIVREPFAGAWQRGEHVTIETSLSNPTLFRCVSLISSDIAKMGLCLVEQEEEGIWEETSSSAFSPVLKRPNRYQNRIQFMEAWVHSKLTRGNTYVLKVRDNRRVVTELHILDPQRCRAAVAPDGAVYYSLSADNLAGVGGDTYVPASEIIHDRWNTLFHPLVGLSPIYACGLAALQGQEIQRNSTRFFRNASRPGGILTAPANIPTETADRIKAHWDDNYTGENAGRVAVLGDGLEYKAMGLSPDDALLVEQLKWTAETICSVFGVPPYMVGVGPAPLNNNVEALSQQYYSQCLQILIEAIELCLDEGLALPANYGTQFNLDDLLRMDTATQVKTLAEGVKGALIKPDEARRKLNLGPVPGGDAVYLQQQNYSLEALAKRDAQADPFGSSQAAPAAAAPPPAANDQEPGADAQDAQALMFGGLMRRHLLTALETQG